MRYWLLTATLLLVGACSHPLQISGKGDIISDSGTRDCTYEDFSSYTDPGTEPCPNYVAGHYFETYTAQPRPGWIFNGWDGCDSPTHQCTFNVDADTVNQHIGETAPPLVAHFEQRYSFERIPYRVVDAKYIRRLDLLVSLADDDHLYLYDVASHTTTSIDLGLAGNRLSVSPDGTRAAVTHNSYLSHVDLVTGTVLATHSLPKLVYDLQLDDSGVVHIMENADRGERMKSMDLSTGTITDASGYPAGYLLEIDIHQSGDFIYGVSTYSNRIDKFDIRGGTAERLDPVSAPNGNGHCNNLWLSDDGLNMFTACGTIFYTSESIDSDRTVNATLHVPEPPYSYPQQRIAHLSHSGNEVLHLGQELADRVEVHQYIPLVYQGERRLPEVTVGDEDFQSYGHFVFHTAAGSHIVVAAIDEASGLHYNHGIVRTLPINPAVNVTPSALTGSTLYAELGEVPIDGSQSFDPEDEPLAYTWQLVSAPAGSAAYPNSPASAQTTFNADQKGSYLFSLVVNDGTQNSEPAYLEVVVEDPTDKFVVPLDFLLEDAEYSPLLDRVVMVASAPSRLIQYNLADGSFHSTLLPFPAETVSVAPDGRIAAVGHSADQRVSIVNLETEAVTLTYFSTTDIGDLVLAGNGYVHMFPSTGQHTNIFSLNVLTGQVTLSGGNSVRQRTKGDLHPSGNYMYGADNGVSPSDIEVYGIGGGAAIRLADSPYHGDYDICGDIWVSETGNHLFTRCGNLFNASPETADDMTFAGWLDTPGRIKSLSNAGDEVALLTDSDVYVSDETVYSRLRLFSFDERRLLRDIELPPFDVEGTDYASHGRFVFHDSTGSALLALIQAENASGLLFDSALYIHRR